LQQADADVLSERKAAMDEWRAFVDSKREFVALALGFKKQMFGARAEAKESHMVKQQVEQIVESKEEPYVAK
jgi:translation initiation factor 3 subunit B